MENPKKSKKSVLIVGGIGAALVVILLLVGTAMFFIGGRSPEKTVEKFYEELSDGDTKGALSYTIYKDYADDMSDYFGYYFVEDFEGVDIKIKDTEITYEYKDSCDVEITIVAKYSGYEQELTQTHYLEKDDGEWLIIY